MSVQPTSSSLTAPASAGAADRALLAPVDAPGAGPGAAPSAAPNARDEAINFAHVVMGSERYTGFVPADRGHGGVIHNALRTLGSACKCLGDSGQVLRVHRSGWGFSRSMLDG